MKLFIKFFFKYIYLSLNDKIYPVGCIVHLYVDTDPATLLGVGVWTQITDRFLLAKGSTYTTLGATGGEATHKLTTNELPSHSHTIKEFYANGSSTDWVLNVVNQKYSWGSSHSGSTGGNAAHNNMPPYLVVYIWRRTS